MLKLRGKNPTNLKVHLQTNHREEYKSIMAKDSERKTTIGNDKVNEGATASSSQTQLQQQTLTLCFQKSEVWPTNSNEHKKRENALVDLFVETGMSTRLCDSVAFKSFNAALDRRFITPSAAQINSLIALKMQTASQRVKEMLRETRKVTICVDGWSKKGLTASFLGISACFSHCPSNQSQHALLNLCRICHPHTGEAIANCIKSTLDEWGIPGSKILLIVTDNGSNMIKAVELLKKTHSDSTEVAQYDASDNVDSAESDSDSQDECAADEDQGKFVVFKLIFC